METNFEVAVRPRTVPCAAYECDLLTFVNLVSHINQDLAVMGILCEIAVLMIDLYEVAVGWFVACRNDCSAICCINRCPCRTCQIDALVESSPSHLESRRLMEPVMDRT